MTGLNIFLILLSAITIIAVVVALKTPFFIKDSKERASQAIHFLLGIIAGYIFGPLGGIIVGIVKELGEVTLEAHQRLFSRERILSVTRALMFWFIGGFFGSHALEYFRNSFLLIFGV